VSRLAATETPLADGFDYVIVGAGSAGCVLANRLTEDPRTRVLLVEAGGTDRHPLIHVPAGFLRLLDHPRLTWGLRTEPDPDTADRAILFPRGKGLGGSSSINGLLHVRGQPEDYDHWARLGNRGWSFADVLPYFRKSESWEGDDPWRGRDGPISVRRLTERPPLCEAIIAAGRDLGLPYLDDINGPSQAGIGYYQQTRQGRWRASAARAYLAPALKRPNLAVLLGAHVRRIRFEGRRAVGIEYDRDGRIGTATAAREVILAAGVVGSPHLLQLSGVGAPEALKSAGIGVTHALPGVGQNLQDHYVVRLCYRVSKPVTLNERARGLPLAREMAKFAFRGTGILTYSAALVGAFVRTRAESATPDVQYVFAPGSFKGGRLGELDDFPGLTCGCWQMRPESRGSVEAKSPDPREAPAIRPRYLSDAADREAIVAGLEFARRLCAAPALAPFRDAEVVPGPAVNSADELLDYARRNGSTVYHAVGTCQMGIHARAVVDDRLRVRGLGGLRVIDASVMPTITSTNTNATTIMIAEKGADLVRERA
jgi:choline dehydrogenase